MKTRIKKTAPVLPDRAHAEGCAREITLQILEERRLKTKMDATLAEVRKGFEEEIAHATEGLAIKVGMLAEWAEANPSEFDGKKSLDMLHAVIGWRTGQPQAKTLPGWTWARVLENIKTHRSAFYALFVRVKEEVNKEQFIAERENMPAEEMRALGVRIVQDEAFFVEPKVEDLAARQEKEVA